METRNGKRETRIRIKKRNWTQALVVGKGESVELETISVFNKPRQTGEVLIKAVVLEGGFLNLRGLIKIEKQAILSEAFLRQKVLLVGKGARAVAIPELEIETDEVKASHAATVGQIDEEQVFYLQSRGLSEDQAKKLIIEAFLKI